MVSYGVLKQYLMSVTLMVWVQCSYSRVVLADKLDRTNGAIRDMLIAPEIFSALCALQLSEDVLPS